MIEAIRDCITKNRRKLFKKDEKTIFTFQGMHGLQKAFHLEKEMGEGMGRRKILQ